MNQPPNQPPYQPQYGRPGRPAQPQPGRQYGQVPGQQPPRGAVPPQGAPRPPQGFPPPQGPGPQRPAPQRAAPQGPPPQGQGYPGQAPQYGGAQPAHQGFAGRPGQHGPQQPAQYGSGQVPGVGAAGGQGLVVDAQFFPLAWIFYFVKPKIFVNGQQFPAVWKQNVIPLAPGRYHLHVHTPYFLPPKVGPVDTEVVVNPGQFVPLEYKTPLFAFSKGSLGPAPQKYNGVGITVALVIVPFVLMFLFLLIIAASL